MNFVVGSDSRSSTLWTSGSERKVHAALEESGVGYLGEAVSEWQHCCEAFSLPDCAFVMVAAMNVFRTARSCHPLRCLEAVSRSQRVSVRLFSGTEWRMIRIHDAVVTQEEAGPSWSGASKVRSAQDVRARAMKWRFSLRLHQYHRAASPCAAAMASGSKMRRVRSTF